jgi:hypothetical protein
MRIFLLAAATMGALLCPAKADTLTPLTHDIVLFGTSYVSPVGPPGLTILSGNPFMSTFEHGDLTALGDGGSVVWRNQGSSFPSLTTGSNLSCGANCLVSGVNNGLTFTINVLSLSGFSTLPDPEYVIANGSAIATLTGFAPTEGTYQLVFALSSQVKSFAFAWVDPPYTAPSSTVVATPLPGALALFAPGLFALWMLGRKRKTA